MRAPFSFLFDLFEGPSRIIYRPYLVFASSFVLLFSVFMAFVATGWPGNPTHCVYDEPDDSCYCEAFNLQDVEEGKPGVRQPVNTWFNLLVVFASGFVAWRMSEDRKLLFSKQTDHGEHCSLDENNERTDTRLDESMTEIDGTVASEAAVRIADEEEVSFPRNVMLSDNLIADWYVVATVFYGIGKMYFHGSLTIWGTYVDGVGSYLFYAFMPWYTIRRVNHSDQVFWLGYLGTVAVAICAQVIFGPMLSIYTLVLFYLLMEVYMGATKGVFFMGTCKSVSIWILALVVTLVAVFFWWTSRTGRMMCDPDSFWQIHGLVWHPLTNIIMVLLYLYWRLGDDEDLEDAEN
jgi:hypothetical protein